MKILNKILFTLILTSLVTNIWAVNWQKKSAPFPGHGRKYASSFVIGNNAYVGGGGYYQNNNFYLKDFWKYDQSKSTWTQIADFPGEGRTDAVAFSLNGKGYFGLGSVGNTKFKDFYEYDPVANFWKKIADFPGGARTNAVAFTIGNTAYVGSGNDGNHKGDFYKYTNGTWSAIASLPKDKERTSATAFSVGDFGYVAGGGYVGVLGSPSDMYKYDPKKNTWTAEVNWNGSVLNSNVLYSYVSSGTPFFCRFDELSKYNFASGSFDELGDVFKLGEYFSGETFFVINNVPYMTLGGEGSISVTYNVDLWSDTEAHPAGISDVKNETLQIYPNPVADHVIITSDLTGEFQLFSTTGSQIIKQSINPSNRTINLSHLPSGVYIASVKTSNTTYSTRLIKK